MSSEKDIRQERLDKELILKQWMLENPFKARIWYAHYSRSTECGDLRIKNFLNQLGTASDRDFETNSYWDGYENWEKWLNEYEAYCEFKSKAPEIWKQIKDSKYRVYIYDAAKRLFEDLIEHRHITCNTYRIINKWIKQNQELWNEITSMYSSAIKTDEEYFFQAWMEFFHWHDTFSVWKYKNPSLWDEFKKDCAKMTYLISNCGSIRDVEYIKSKWKDDNSELWRQWKEEHQTEWRNFYESHKTVLWYAYIEEVWSKLSVSKKIEIECRDIPEFSESCIDDLYDGFDDMSNDLHEFQLEWLNECINYRFYPDEENVHKTLINNYKNDILLNAEKHSYLSNVCTEDGLEQFIKSRNSPINKLVETPECYADRKILDIWCAENEKQWLGWKCYYCWNEKFKDLCYDWKEYYEVWKILYVDKWSEWIRQYFVQWKQKAQYIDLWFAWLSDNNELAFHQWASLYLENWDSYIDMSMNLDYSFAYSSLFDSLILDFKEWKENNPKEWIYWKEFIKEQILIDEFSHSNLCLPYSPEYDLHIQIQKKLYKHKIGKKIFYNHLSIICHNGKYGYINEKGEIVIPINFDRAFNFCDGLALVEINCKQIPSCGKNTNGQTFIGTIKSGGKWGVINTKGEYIARPQYDYLSSFNRGIAIFEIGGDLNKNMHECVLCDEYNDGKYGAINTKGEVVVQPIFAGLKQLENGVLIAKDCNSKKWGMLNNTGVLGAYDVIEVLNNGLYKVNVGLKYKVEQHVFGETVFVDYEEGKWGLLSATGEQLTPLKYTYLSSFHNGRALVNVNSRYNRLLNWPCIGGLWGYINEKGEEVMQLIECDDYLDFEDKITRIDCLDYLDVMAKEQSMYYSQYENWLLGQEILDKEN